MTEGAANLRELAVKLATPARQRAIISYWGAVGAESRAWPALGESQRACCKNSP